MGDAEKPQSPWVGREGDLAHPDAAAGGGGEGNFKRAGQLGTDGNDSDPVRHPQSPSARIDGLTPPETVQLDSPGVKFTDVKRNPPPATTTGKVHTITVKDASTDINIEVEVLADTTETGNTGGVRTVLNPGGLTIDYPQFETPPRKLDKDGNEIIPKPEKVAKVVGKYTVSGKITIQVVYGDQAKSTDGAAWGRGTTDADVKKLDTTTGFHESCHLADFTSYLKTKPFPKFDGKVGDTTDDFEAKQKKNDTAIADYFKKCEDDSRTTTDEVGTKMSDYVKTHAGVSGH